MRLQWFDLWLLSCLSAFFFTSGASLWETFLFVPAWSGAAPASFRVFTPPYSIDPAIFWGITHSVFELTLIITVVLNWKLKERRLPLIGIAAVYVLMRIFTLVYFAPTFIHFHGIAAANFIDEALTQKTLQWEHLNYVRTAIIIADNLALLGFCMRTFASDVAGRTQATPAGRN
jgi:hypothetical protein